MKVENVTSNKGNKVANQFIITDDKGTYFQSYRSIIVFRPFSKEHGFYQQLKNKSLNDCGLAEYPKLYLDYEMWDYSVTTGTYRNQFLGETKAETQKKIDSGEYVLTDLN